jgi:hypothetical protein
MEILTSLSETIQNRVITAIHSHTINLSEAQIRNNVLGTLTVQNQNTYSETPDVESHSRFQIDQITPEALLTFFEGITKSNTDIRVEELEWTFVVIRGTDRIGAGAVRIPPWVLDCEKETWKQQTYVGTTINCGAFAIAWLTANQTERRDLLHIKRRAFGIQSQFRWGEYVSVAEVGRAMNMLYPRKRLTIIQPALNQQENFTYTGSLWESRLVSLNTGTKLVDAVYMVYCPLEKHFGVCDSPKRFFRHLKAGRIFCHKCLTSFPRTNACRCNNADEIRIKLKNKCEFCKTIGCINGNCPKKCTTCGVQYKKYSKPGDPVHRCIVVDKEELQEFLMPGELPTHRKPKYRLWAYDLESRVKLSQEKTCIRFETNDHEFTNMEVPVYIEEPVREHQVNLVIYRDVFDPNSEQVIFGDDCLERFIDIMTTENKGRNICVAHNASGYDSRLVLETIIHKGLQGKPDLMARGTKFMQIRVGNTLFRDSLLHLPGSLANLAKSFNLNMRKGYFPHMFNTEENYSYVGPVPDQRYFDLTFMAKSANDVTEFKRWHAERSTEGPWNFQEELVSYCRDDVMILASIMLKFHVICNEKFGESPFFSVTSPSYVHKMVKKNITAKLNLPSRAEKVLRGQRVNELALISHWGILVSNEYWFARKALRGGRTDVRKIYHKLTPEEEARGCKIMYQDIVSMYPYVQVARDYPVGLPVINVYDFAYYPCSEHCTPTSGNVGSLICNCGQDRRRRRDDKRLRIVEHTDQPNLEALCNDPTFFGFICAHMIPPRNLYHPVLVHWSEEHGKCIASLDPMTGVFTSEEFREAIKQGYECVKIYRIDKYNRGPGLWNDFILSLYIEKMANSEPTPSIEKQERLVRRYSELFGDAYGQKIKESFPRWGFNSAARQVYKIMLNSGWGKHCQRPFMPRTSIIDPNDGTQAWTDLLANIDDGNTTLTAFRPVGEQYLVNTKVAGGQTPPNFHGEYLPAGVFVPAYGRLMLLEWLTKLGKRVLYHDTDSIIYIYDPELQNIPQDDIWGCWDEEKISKEGIKEFVSTGPKSYAIKTNRSEIVKLKGVSVKHAHRNIINFEKIKELVKSTLFGSYHKIAIPQYNFKYIVGKGIATMEFIKNFSFKISELKGDLDMGYVYPKGYGE